MAHEMRGELWEIPKRIKAAGHEVGVGIRDWIERMTS